MGEHVENTWIAEAPGDPSLPGPWFPHLQNGTRNASLRPVAEARCECPRNAGMQEWPPPHHFSKNTVWKLVSKLCSKLCSPGPPRRHKAGWAPPSFTANNSAHLCFIHVALHGILFEITRGAAKFFGFSFNLSFGSNFKLQKLQK